jgi:hypothetical protein
MSLLQRSFLCSTAVLCLSATTCVAQPLVASSSSHQSAMSGATVPAGHAQVNVSEGLDIPSATGRHCHGGFFFVSTIHCPQRPGQGCCCRFTVEKHCGCGRYHRISLESMLAELQPGVPVCIGAHGSFVEEREVRSETRARYQRISSGGGNRPFHYIAFHWPSDLAVPFCPDIQTRRPGKRAGFNGIYLAHLTRMIPAANPISFAGHSHGTRVISSALHLLAGGSVHGYRVSDNCPSRRMRAVFGASAIDSHWLSPGEKYGLALNRVECLLNLRTRRDIALTAYPLQDPLLHQALGKTGFQPRQLSRMGVNRQKLREFDVTKYVGCRHEVAHYFPHDAIWLTMAPYLYFD